MKYLHFLLCGLLDVQWLGAQMDTVQLGETTLLDNSSMVHFEIQSTFSFSDTLPKKNQPSFHGNLGRLIPSVESFQTANLLIVNNK